MTTKTISKIVGYALFIVTMLIFVFISILSFSFLYFGWLVTAISIAGSVLITISIFFSFRESDK